MLRSSALVAKKQVSIPGGRRRNKINSEKKKKMGRSHGLMPTSLCWGVTKNATSLIVSRRHHRHFSNLVFSLLSGQNTRSNSWHVMYVPVIPWLLSGAGGKRVPSREEPSLRSRSRRRRSREPSCHHKSRPYLMARSATRQSVKEESKVFRRASHREDAPAPPFGLRTPEFPVCRVHSGVGGVCFVRISR